MDIKRKISAKILSLFLAAVLVLTGVPMAAAAEKSDFVLATTADMHYYPKSLAGNGRSEALLTYLGGSNAVYEDMDAMMEASFESLKYEVEHNGVKNIMLVGDLTTNGEYEGHIALAAMLEKFEKETGANVWVTTGNHDINNPDASSFEHNYKEEARMTTPQEFVAIYENFGFNEYYHRYKDFNDGTQGALTYSVKLSEDGIRLIVVDGGKYTADATSDGEPFKETGGAFFPEQVEWIKAEAADAIKDGEIPLLFTHWNMSEMNYMHEKVLQGFVIDDGYKLQEELADAGIHYAYSGHQHVTDLDVTYSDSGEPMYSVITPSLTQFPFAYRTTTFSRNADGSIDATFEQKDIDEYSQVSGYGRPYSDLGFGKLYSGPGQVKPDAAKYIMQLIKKGLGGYIDEINETGSIIKFIEKKAEIDIKEKIKDKIYGGIMFEGYHILTPDNAMSFLHDIDSQLMKRYFHNLPLLYGTIEKAIQNLVDLPVTENTPCTKFIDKYKFGDASKPGTFGDVVLSVMAYFYSGNEDISDDVFMQEFLEFAKTPEFTDFLINALRKNIVEDIALNEILANVDINLDAFFFEDPTGAIPYIQSFIELVVAIVGSNIFKADSLEALIAAIGKCINELEKSRLTVTNLAKAILAGGLIKYGGSLDEILDFVINKYITDDFRRGLAYEAEHVIGSMVKDDEKDYGPDVKYTYSGPEKVIPTKEDMQLPVNVTLAPGKNAAKEFTATWFTKYSVQGSDIEIMKKGTGEFTGKATDSSLITSTSEKTIYTHPGFDAGVFGILPWEEEVIKHTVTVKGLEPGTEYVFRIGDAEKGFWEEGSVKTAPAPGGKFTFIHISDTDGVIPSDYENAAGTLDAAKKEFPDAQLAVHTGNLTAVPGNDRQWLWATDKASEHYSSMPLIYAAGANDAGADCFAEKHLTVNTLTEQRTDNGFYYSYDYGSTHFTVLDTNLIDKDGTLSAAQLKWLDNDLKNSEAIWNILVMNKSIYGASDNENLKGQLLKLMERYKIDLILQGSDNVYVRTNLLFNDKPLEELTDTQIIELDGNKYTAYEDARGTVAVISGSAGRHFPDTAPENPNFDKSAAYGRRMFSAVTVDGDILALGAYTVDEHGNAERVDQFALKKKKTEIKTGDGNRDNIVSADDARLALRYSVGLEENIRPINRIAMDVDFSGSVDAADARLILRFSVKLDYPDPEYIYVYNSDLDRM